MRRVLLTVFFLVVLIGCLIAWMPAGFVIDRINPEARAIGYERASGTVWDGQVSGLTLAGETLGQLRFQLQPAALVSGRVAGRVDIDGPVGRLRGRVEAAPSGAVWLKDMVGDINIHALNAIDPLLRRSPSELNLSLSTLVLDSEGRCLQADGDLQTDLLVVTGRRWNWNGPTLSGAITCDGSQLAADLSSPPDDAEQQVTASARLDLMARLYDVTARVETEDRRLADVLIGLDFARAGDGFEFHRTNRPQPAISGELGN